MVIHATIAGHAVSLDSSVVVRSLSRIEPEPVRKHYVQIGNRRIPVRQALSAVTGIDKAEFQSHQARSIFRRLGLKTGQVGVDWQRQPTSRPPRPSLGPADELRPYVGKFVAIEGGRVVVSADSPLDVIAWLRDNGRTAETMFRVPVDPHADAPKFDL